MSYNTSSLPRVLFSIVYPP